MPCFLYILKCRDGSYYTGITRRSLEERVTEHNRGIDSGAYTFRRRPIKLAFSEEFTRMDEAIVAERRIKTWSRAKKEALISGDFDRLRLLSNGL